MKIRKLIAAVTAVALVSAVAGTEASAEKRKKEKKKSRQELVLENDELQSDLDSLKAELEGCKELLKEIEEAEKAEAEAREDLFVSKNERPIEYTPEISDSLYGIWLNRRMVDTDELKGINMDSVRFESNVPDSVYMQRLASMHSFIPLPYNDVIRNYIIMYSQKMAKGMQRIMGLAEYYMPIFEETFNRYNMPEELKAMAIIESMLNPTIESPAGAKGMWQFMYQTGKHYGLTIDSFVDERMDPVKSADAAARYLKDAYDIFGDWTLAIASYNCGAGNINKAIRRCGGKRDFWELYPYLPEETRGYVPAFVAALYTLEFHSEHGIEPLSCGMPAVVDTFKINKMLHFKQISEYAGVPHEVLKDLNPQYRHEIIPGNEREYLLRLPYQYSDNFIDHEDSLYNYKKEVYFNPVSIKKIKDGGDGHRIVYKVKSGDVLGKIATRHRCTVAQIKKWNRLKSNNIRIGQKLVLYTGGKSTGSSSSSSTSSKKSSKSSGTAKASKPIPANTPFTWYTIQEGESLYLIAKKYPGVSAENIMSFNGISSNVRAGMKIKIPKL